MMSYFISFTTIIFLACHYQVEVSTQVILEVPGYGILNGTTELSSFTERPYYAFRSLYYAEKPSPQNRFLVIFAT
jgi:hypothetical protein